MARFGTEDLTDDASLLGNPVTLPCLWPIPCRLSGNDDKSEVTKIEIF